MITFSQMPAFGLRLGNFMFNLAAMYAKALSENTNAVIPNFPGARYLAYFNTPNNIGVGPVRGTKSWRELSFLYSPIPEGDNFDISGYFQSEKYFKEYESKIRELYKFNLEYLRPGIVAIGNDLQGKDSCFIHVRRTDYLNLQYIHTNLGATDYYQKAVEAMKEPDTSFYIFSDDPDWCVEFFKFIPGATVVHGTELEDLFLMSRCKKAITANSSFSWWGAWLGDEKRVIAPKNWFCNETPLTDLIPERWELV